MFKHILVPTDGSQLSQETAQSAVRLAAEAGAQVTFVYVRPDYPVSYFGEGALTDPTTPESFNLMTEQASVDILQRAARIADGAGVAHHSCSAVNDRPYEAIIGAATEHGCDLIFMASHGRRGLASLLLGSETQKVLTHSTIPVLVYRSPTAK